MADGKWVVISSKLYTLDPAGNGDPRRQLPHNRGDVLTGLSDAEVRHFVGAGGIAPYGSDEAKAAQAPLVWPVHPAVGEVPSGPAIADERAAAAIDYAPTAAPAPIVSISDGPDFDDAADDLEAAEVAKPVKPAKSATKPVLIAYFVASGKMTAEEANALSRNDLRDKLK